MAPDPTSQPDGFQQLVASVQRARRAEVPTDRPTWRGMPSNGSKTGYDIDDYEIMPDRNQMGARHSRCKGGAG